MGGGSYSGDVAERTRSTTSTGSSRSTFFQYEQKVAKAAPKERTVHKDLNPKGKNRECRDNADHSETTPIVGCIDLTPSRGNDLNTITGKMPMLIGQIYLKDYVAHPTFCTMGVGDATCDSAPLHVGQFEADNRIDDDLSKLWREKGGGGGTGEESYELAAYFGSRHMELDATKRGKNGYFFFFADESPYKNVSRQQVERIIGDKLKDDIPTSVIMKELQEKFHTFVIFPRKSVEERKEAIDEEIKKLVERAGGQIDDVDVRASLIWYDRNDLDIHCITPRGEEIYYGNKKGILDVDMNVHGETTKPVENIRWKKGSAPAGDYRFFVQNFAYHESTQKAIPFRVEVVIGGEVQHFEGVIPAHQSREDSNYEIGTFHFDPQAVQVTGVGGKSDKYVKYREEVVVAEWRKYLPESHILTLDDAHGIVDVVLGVLAINSGKRDLDGYQKDLADKDQTAERIADVTKALAPLAEATQTVTVSLPAVKSGAVRKGKTRRI